MSLENCPKEQELLDFVQGRLDHDSIESVEDHLDSCPSCLRVVAELARSSLANTTPALPLEGPPTLIAGNQGQAAPRISTEELRIGTMVNRFTLLGEVGRGGMGVVWTAYDPELDRRVALKFIHPHLGSKNLEQAQIRMKQEAQAMAKLHHPNVVTVYDVGLHGQQLYIAMEYVNGANLRDWLRTKKPSWPEVLKVLLSAGSGLLSAHQQGLVHRDVKPDNILIAEDARVLVTDFGLVQTEPDRTQEPGGPQPTGFSGTPFYSSPEQLDGKPVDSRSDQFSFCVTAWEALFGERPFSGSSIEEIKQKATLGILIETAQAKVIPRKLSHALRCGLSPDPAGRHKDMQALLEAMSSKPSQRKLFWLGIGLVPVCFLLGIYLWPNPPCEKAASNIESMWNEQRKATLSQAFLATQIPYAKETLRRFVSNLNSYASSWSAMRKEACEATKVEGKQSDSLMDLRMHCLDRRLSEMDALIQAYSGSIDEKGLEKAVETSLSLTPLTGCADAEALTAQVPLPEDLSKRAKVEEGFRLLDQAKALSRMWKNQESMEIAKQVLSIAQEVPYEPLEAQALCQQAKIHSQLSAYQQAEQNYQLCAEKAAKVKDDQTAGQAWSSLVGVVGADLARTEEGLKWAKVADAFVARAGNPPNLLASLFHNKARVLDKVARYDEALVAVQKAKTILSNAGNTDPIETVGVLESLGKILHAQGHPAEALEIFNQVVALRQETLGKEHPLTLSAILNVAQTLNYVRRFEESLSISKQCLSLSERITGRESFSTAIVHFAMGTSYKNLGRYEEAVSEFEKALIIVKEIYGNEHPKVATVLDSLGQSLAKLGKDQEALQKLNQSLEMQTKILGPGHPSLAYAYKYIAQVYANQGDHEKALRNYIHVQQIREEKLGTSNVLVADSLSDIGFELLKLMRVDEAEAATKRGIKIIEQDPKLDPSLKANMLCVLAEIYLVRKKYSLAKSSVEEAIRLRENEPFDPNLQARYSFLLARALWATGKDRPRALLLANKARETLQTAGKGYQNVLHDVEHWLSKVQAP